MGLERLLARLRAEMDAVRFDAQFEIGRALEPALARHQTSGDVLVALHDRNQAEYARRDALVSALVRLHQRTKTSYWASMLTVTFAPMLRVLRASIRGDVFDSGDLDQLVVEGFLRAITTQPTTAKHMPVRLRRGTRKFVFARLDAERERRGSQRLLERTVNGDELFLNLIPKVPHASDADESAELLSSLVGQAVSQRRLELVVATRLRGMSLGSYIRSGRVPWNAASEPIETVLQRTKRERSRTLRQLRPIIEVKLAAQSELRAASELDLFRAS